MAHRLLEVAPPFREAIEQCEQALSPHVAWSLREVLADEEGAWLDRLDIVQPALFAVMVALARLWRVCGVTPAAVLGHSQGEIAAAHVAGALSLEDAARAIAARAAAMAKIAGKGTMASVSLRVEQLRDLLAPHGARLSLAAINGPASQIVSGEVEAVEALLARCEAEGIRAQRIAVDYAAHSPQIDGLREELLEAFAPIEPMPAAIPIYSTVSGEQVAGESLDGAYWYRNLRETVLFEPALANLIGEGRRRFVEISPHPVLAFGIQESAEASVAGEPVAVVESLRRDEDPARRFALSLGAAYAGGIDLDWEALFAGSGAKRIPLPTYPFQRERYWLSGSSGRGDLSAAGLAEADHPLLGAALASPRGEGFTLTGRISLSTHPWLTDHAVSGTVLLPGTALLELALAAAERCGAPGVAELTLRTPLILTEQSAASIQVAVSGPDERGRREIAIYSRAEGADGKGEAQWAANAGGALSAAPEQLPEPLGEWPPPGASELEAQFLYDRLAELGYDYGSVFQGLTEAWEGGGGEVYAEVALGEDQREAASRYLAHPALFDAALHAIPYLGGADATLRLPFSWSGVGIGRTGAARLRVRLTRAGEGAVRLELWDGEGLPVARVESLALREIPPGQLKSGPDAPSELFELGWRPSELAEPRGERGSVEELGERALAEIAGAQDPPRAIVWRHRAPSGTQVAAGAAREGAGRALELIQAWLAEDSLAQTKLVFLTERAVAAGAGESPELAGSALWGLVRSAQAEHPGRFGLVDSDGVGASEDVLAAAALDSEPQLALREGAALRPRVAPAGESGDLLVPPAGPWRLAASAEGTLEGLSLEPWPEAAAELGAGEVRVAMRAAGVNFRDVLIALGLYPGTAELGSEGAGVVVEVGEEVRDLAPGDRVMGMVLGSLGPLARADARLLTPIPAGWSFAQAAAIPTVYLTALHGLHDLAALREGERVLIHAGAGGVGMAAICLAQRAGAEVFATASPAKWEVLEGLGLDRDHIASSRDLAFREEFMDASGGEGMDVVLNSLAGEFVDASLDLLGEGGRLIEMGKTDIRDPERIASSHPGVAYRAFDLIETGADRMGELLARVSAQFAAGELRHAPCRSWDIRRAPEAFRHLREGHNVGKVVLKIPQPLDREKTVLITGATGGLGALVARRLVAEHGARHLLLASRSGEAAEGATELRAELEALGATVRIAACDVSDRAQLEDLLAGIDPERPLGAVFHAAGALADATVASMDREQLEAVFAPKAEAALHLHELTGEAPLEAFVCFSSIAGTMGTPGQANYAAANVFLDALAARRRAEGRPATSIAWGLWAARSAMTRELGEADLRRLERLGVQTLSDEQGLELFDAALRSDDPLCLAIRVSRSGLAAQARAGSLPAIFSGLVRTPARRASGGALGATLASLPEAERLRHVETLVAAEVAAVLGHGSAMQVEPTRAFKELGFDSLAAVELRSRLEQATAVSLSATAVFDYPNLAALAERLLSIALDQSPGRRSPRRLAPSEEPIAIVGMACRYPGGVASPEELWRLVAEGRDGIAGFPADRGWNLERLYDPDPDQPGTSYAREGGFLADPAGFDAEFFGIAPREALAMDPQQRLLLETCWEALEDAGIAPAALAQSATGVFAGLSSRDYVVGAGAAARETEGYRLTGAITSVASGRVAYALGLEGPAMTIDTACSSSLVAIHLAAQALRGGECELALAGGATVLATPEIFTEFARQRGLAPDGRCKSFADAADGTGFSEGVGVVLLERLADARENGHEVLATIRGSAVNQDGASNGLTAPNGPSQERVIRQALANAELEPRDVDAVEAHGTGTTLGDPIEAGALLATYGQDRERPLRIGSLKSNIGHTQAAAGVAGVIKMAMALREGLLPKTLHVDTPSSKVEWGRGAVELLTEQLPWEQNGRPRRVGVSSFGISGTNAHLILEQALPEDRPAAQTAPLVGPVPLPLSAKSEPALTAAAERLRTRLEAEPGLDPTDLAYSLATARTAFEQRAVAIGSDRKELLAALAALSAGEPSPDVLRARARQGKLAFLFSGQGSQRLGMGSELRETDAVYAASFAAVCEQLDAELVEPLAEVVFAAGAEAATRLDRTSYAQPALFAVEVALFRALESRGLRPDLLAGHSIGELAAAHLAGVLSLPDAARLVCARARLMGELPGGGAMLALAAGEREVAAWVEGREERIAIAAINSPSSCVLSGAAEAIEEAEGHFAAEGRKTKRLAVSHAFHSPLMEPMLAEFAEVARGLDYSAPQIPIVSNLTGGLLSDEQAADPAYWVSHVRQPVRFADAVRTIADQGASALVELGPDPVLLGMAEETLGEQAGVASVATLREGRPELRALSAALAAAHAAGAGIDWDAFFAGTGAGRVPLPTYPFQHERFWLAPSAGAGDLGAAGLAEADHPLLGAAIEDPESGALTLTGSISLATHPWLADHAVLETPILPATAFLELALAAAARADCEAVDELTLEAPMVLPPSTALQLQVSVSAPGEDGARAISIHSRPQDGGEEPGGNDREWTAHAAGVLSARAPAQREQLGDWPPAGAEPIEVESLYDRLAERGFGYGPAFQGLTAAWRDGAFVYAEVFLAGERAPDAKLFGLHPALLDGAFHAALDVALADAGPAELPLPFSWRGVRIDSPGASSLRVRVASGAQGFSLLAADGLGAPVVAIESLAMRPLEPSQLEGRGGTARPLHALEWTSAGPPASANGSDPTRTVALGGADVSGIGAEPYADLAALLGAIEEGAAVPEVVVAGFGSAALLDEAGADVAAASGAAAELALALAQDWAAAEPLRASRLVFLTRNAVAVGAGEDPDLVVAPVWGVLRAAQSEHPGRFALVDLDRDGASPATLRAAFDGAHGEPQLAVRGDALLAPRLVAGEAQPAPDPDAASVDPERTILITGGTGGLGRLFARHLVERHGARHLLLVSRSGRRAAGAAELEAELSALGAEVTVAACDASERERLKELIDELPEQHPLGAVVHAAGVLDDGLLESLDPERMRRVMQPKADAAWRLHELTEELELSDFILFSSAAGLLGNASQANYAAANAFLDALAAHRRARGLPATSLAWGLWGDEGGMAGGIGEAGLARLRRTGFAALSGEQGLELFDAARASTASLLAPVRFDAAALRAAAAAGVLPPLLSGLVHTGGRRPTQAGSLARRLAGVAEADRQAAVLEFVRGHVAAVLGHGTAEAVETERAFQEMGFDSLAAVELRNRLGAASGLRLPATLVFDHPTPAAIAAYLAAEVSAGEGGPRQASGETAFREALARVPISRLRDAGVMGTLMELVDVEADSLESRDDMVGRIREMDIDELVEQTLEQQAAGGAGEEA